jgi:DNA repair photolyase
MEITRKNPNSFLTKTNGYLQGYSYSLNPYVGCSYGCHYCYVQKLPVALFKKKEWGTWVEIKDEKPNQFLGELKRAKKKGKVTIFMSSSTDPYQPLEAKELRTRRLLEVIAEMPPDFLFVQTRSPLVTRDIDIFQKLGDRVLVSITIETDRDDVRKIFSPKAPPIQARINALKKLNEENIPSQAAVSPVLPFSPNFTNLLRNATKRVCLDDFFLGDGSGGRRSQALGLSKLFSQIGEEEWFSPENIKYVKDLFLHVFAKDQLFISRQGFIPPDGSHEE